MVAVSNETPARDGIILPSIFRNKNSRYVPFRPVSDLMVRNDSCPVPFEPINPRKTRKNLQQS